LQPKVLTWIGIALTAAAASGVMSLAGLTSPSLLGGCVGAAAFAFVGGRHRWPRVQMSRPVRGLAQAVLGVHLGLSITIDALRGIGTGWLLVLAVLIVTVLSCMAAAVGVSKFSPMTVATAQMGMMPGGATVSIAVSDDVGTDPRIVAVMQYTRVYLILASLPIVAHSMAGHLGSEGDAASAKRAQSLVAIGLILVCVAVTMPLMRCVTFPSGYLLIPLVLAICFTVATGPGTAGVPDWLLATALGMVGVFVGLQVTPDSLREARDSFPAILVAVVAVILVCGGLGAALAASLDKPLVDGYLATSPGGVNVIFGIVSGGGLDLPFITAAQIMRILLTLLVLPLLGNWHLRRSRA
jgi:membrane AbrB-like protein